MQVSVSFFCGNFWCFHFWQEFCPGLRGLSVYKQCVPEAESHCFFSWCYRLFCDSALMLPQILHEWPGFQALFNSLTLPSAVGTHSSGLCPHFHASLCCALWFPSQPACYCVGLLTLLLTSSLSAAVGEIKDPSPFRALQRWDNHPTEVTCENSGSTPCGLRVPFSTLPWLLKAH